MSVLNYGIPSIARRKRHIDWDRAREELLITLVIKYKAHKKTNSTMEEKWGRISRELFSLDAFKDFVELDGYTLQKKFSRLKRKISAKYQIYSADFTINALPLYVDDLEKIVAKLLVEELVDKRDQSKQRGNGKKLAGKRDDDDIEEERRLTGSASPNLDEGHTFDVHNLLSRKRARPSSDSGSESERDLTANVHASLPSSQLNSSPIGRANYASLSATASSLPSHNTEEFHRSSAAFSSVLDSNEHISFQEHAQPPSPAHSQNESIYGSSSKTPKFDLEFEKEKERRRLNHLERMELLKLEYMMKQSLLRLEAEIKQSEAQIKLADAHKAQAEVTQALLHELQSMRQQREPSAK